MKYSWMDDYLMKKTGVTKDLKEEWNWIRYMVGGKMFAAICLDGANENKPIYITLKLDPLDGDFLRQQYEDIIPGYYMNKVHWNSINPDGEVPDDLLKDMLDKSYELVLRGFSKKRQQEILLTTYCGLDCTNCEYKEVSFCGEYTDFSCQLLNDYSNDAEYGDDPPGARIIACKVFKSLLTKK